MALHNWQKARLPTISWGKISEIQQRTAKNGKKYNVCVYHTPINGSLESFDIPTFLVHSNKELGTIGDCKVTVIENIATASAEYEILFSPQ